MRATEAVKNISVRMAPYWAAAATTALVSLAFAQLFRWSESIALTYLTGHPYWAIFVIPAAILTSAALAEFFSPTAAGSGIPQLIAGVELAKNSSPFLDKMLGLRMIVVKIVGSCVCVAGGGITGREGPNLQISAAIFNLFRRYWPRAKENINHQSMILAGGAAGLAAAFNTPLGGVVFAVEELAKVHISQIRTAIFHAVLISGILVQAIAGNYLFLGKTTPKLDGFGEILALAFAAALIGFAGGVFGKLSVKALDWRARRARRTRFLITGVCAAGVTVIYYFGGDHALGSGRHVIVDLLAQAQEPVPGSLSVIRGAGNFLTYAGGVIGGVFAPALATGAAMGAWFSQLAHFGARPIFVLVGMTAFLTGLTRTPFTSMILVSEMTDSHDVILALMLGAIVAQGAAKLVDPVSFYEHASARYLKMAAA